MPFPRLLCATVLSALTLTFAPAPAALAEGLSGAYLAGRQARYENDFTQAAEYYSRALILDPNNVELMEDAVTAYIGLGRFDRAAPIARRMTELETETQMSAMALVQDLASKGEFDTILAEMAKDQLKIAPLVDGLVKAWAQIGAGRMSDALLTLDAVAEKPATRAFGLYHKALALALVGDLEGSDAILSGRDTDKLNLTRRGLVAHAEILSQLERNPDAVAVLTDAFGQDLDPGLQMLRAELEAGETLPMTSVRSASDGLAEVFFSVASALNGETPDGFVLNFARVAQSLRPDHTDATLLSASLLESLGRFELATETFGSIPPDSPYFHVAELGRADALQASGKAEAAIEVLQQLTRTNGDIPAIFVTLGDSLRRLERYGEAITAYDRAIELYPEPLEQNWAVYFARGIANEREKHWTKAEDDFRLALKLRPDQPQVLNYLGYSFVERNESLDEALDMIERAVAARPDDGYITDSLGWVFYRLGRYDEAVKQMERAAELMPVDPVINDHLGDVFWAVGRKREAEFQWRRAMSFDPEEVDLKRIRRKLEVGLDTVLKEEGAEPLKVANEG